MTPEGGSKGCGRDVDLAGINLRLKRFWDVFRSDSRVSLCYAYLELLQRNPGLDLYRSPLAHDLQPPYEGARLAGKRN